MGACESDRNIHVEENNMTETNDAVAASPADVGSPLFGPEAGGVTGQTEIKEENDNGITVMAMMTHANAEEEYLENPNPNGAMYDANGEMVMYDEQTGGEIRYYNTLEDAKRAAEESDKRKNGAMGYDEVYVMEQATVAVPVTAAVEEPTKYTAQYTAVEEPTKYTAQYTEEPAQYTDDRAQYTDEPVQYTEEPAQYTDDAVVEAQQPVVTTEEQPVEESQPQKATKDKKKKKKRSWKNWM